MMDDVLRARFDEYAPANALEQENVLQELFQHFVLVSLSTSGFFTKAVFHGGTCLRMLYGTNRFSEDLEFLLRQPNPQFRWHRFLKQVAEDFQREGIDLEIQDRQDAELAVRKAFLKTDSIGKLILLDLPFGRNARRKIRIKLEIDTNPPAGSIVETKYITFPRLAALTTQTLESGFALALGK